MMNESEILNRLLEAIEDQESPIEIIDLLKLLGVKIRMRYGRIEILNSESILTQSLTKQEQEKLFEDLSSLEQGFVKIYKAILYPSEFSKPYLLNQRDLVIPADCHANYRFWLNYEDIDWQPLNPAMTLYEILKELKASNRVMREYIER